MHPLLQWLSGRIPRASESLKATAVVAPSSFADRALRTRLVLDAERDLLNVEFLTPTGLARFAHQIGSALWAGCRFDLVSEVG